MKKIFFTDRITRYFDSDAAECFQKQERKYSPMMEGGHDDFYNQVSKSPINDEDRHINLEKDDEIRHALFYRQNIIYKIIETIKPYEKMNTIAYELAMRTPEIIDAFKSEIKAVDFKKKYWLDMKECISFEKSLCRVLKEGVLTSRDPFVFADRRRGTTMKIPFSYPAVNSPHT